jgi:hypothetical protein
LILLGQKSIFSTTFSLGAGRKTASSISSFHTASEQIWDADLRIVKKILPAERTFEMNRNSHFAVRSPRFSTSILLCLFDPTTTVPRSRTDGATLIKLEHSLEWHGMTVRRLWGLVRLVVTPTEEDEEELE